MRFYHSVIGSRTALATVCGILVLFSCSSPRSDPTPDREPVDRGPKFTEETAREYGEREDRIKAELEALGNHEWAGNYYLGDGLGVNISLTLGPKSGFVFDWHGCLGLYDRNFGRVREEDGRIELACEFENGRKGIRPIAEELIPVRWGSRRYLIAADEMVKFCNAINAGSEPRHGGHGSFLLRRGDSEKEVGGQPEVPGEFRRYLLEKPIEATVRMIGAVQTHARDRGYTYRTVTMLLTVGKRDGVLPGMKFYLDVPAKTAKTAKVTVVREEESEAEARLIMSYTKPPVAGAKASTAAPWKGLRLPF